MLSNVDDGGIFSSVSGMLTIDGKALRTFFSPRRDFTIVLCLFVSGVPSVPVNVVLLMEIRGI